MKVLKPGKWNVPWTGETACPTCEAVLALEESDIKPTYNAYKAFECVCMICGHTIALKDIKLPLRVTEALEKKRKYSTYDCRD